MTTQTLFRLGAFATIVTALGVTVGNLIYFFGDADTISYIWLVLIVYIIQVFAITALFAAQTKRGDLFNFIGFALLIIGTIFNIVLNAAEILFMTIILTPDQVGQMAQISSFATLDLIAIWGFRLGAIIFGVGIFRAGIFPRWAGILLLLAGVTHIFSAITGVLYIFAALLSVSWGWLGLAFWKNPNPAEL